MYVQNTGLIDLEGLVTQPNYPNILQLFAENQIAINEAGFNRALVKMTAMLVQKILLKYDRHSQAI